MQGKLTEEYKINTELCAIKIDGLESKWKTLHGSVHCPYGINGGFSLRHKSAMLKCLDVPFQDFVNWAFKHQYYVHNIRMEDVFYHNMLD